MPLALAWLRRIFAGLLPLRGARDQLALAEVVEAFPVGVAGHLVEVRGGEFL